ncbi:hypothetical protein BGX29_002778 [Mortierella sp. GBA35]|nr:hypothetical protein BGX29_002778 [Mortierella sp. GBA35]
MSANGLRVAIPVGVGIISLAYLSAKLFNSRNTHNRYANEQTIPKVALRKGDSTHDAEYGEGHDAFLLRCEQIYGDVFELKVLNQTMKVVSGPPLAREVYLHEDLSLKDAIEYQTGFRSFAHSIIKSYADDPDNHLYMTLLRDHVNSKLGTFTPAIVAGMRRVLEEQIGYSETPKLNEWPIITLQKMVAQAMAETFMGPEVTHYPEVLETFINCTKDFGAILASRNEARTTSRIAKTKSTYGFLNPMHKHLQTLFNVATPIMAERRRQEKEAAEQGLEYERPKDLMQKMIDQMEHYKLIDLEDICGHLIILILASMHTTIEGGMNVLFSLTAHPEVVEPLYEEIQGLFDQQTKDREEQRQNYRQSLGAAGTEFSFTGTDLDPADDREFTEFVIKKAVKLDSFVKEIFRYRMERISAPHIARADVMLSTGHVIRKGEMVVVNMRSVHQVPAHGDDLTEFRPWRFLGKNSGATKASKDYVPFGLGKHTCPGRFVAVHDIKLIGALVVSNYTKLEAQDETKVPAMVIQPFDYTGMTGLYFTSRSRPKEE